MARAVLGGGCFWCVEGAYKNMRGIESALPGYAGGHDPHPNYNSVCSGSTGHAEVVEIIYDDSIISFETSLPLVAGKQCINIAFFFAKLEHDLFALSLFDVDLLDDGIPVLAV